MEQQRTVEAFTKDIRIFSANVQTPAGDKPAFIIEWHSIRPNGTDMPVQHFLMTPEQVGFLAQRLQDVVQSAAAKPADPPPAQ